MGLGSPGFRGALFRVGEVAKDIIAVKRAYKYLVSEAA
jgi:hypothetical protein